MGRRSFPRNARPATAPTARAVRSARNSTGLAISLAVAKAQIDNGGATMPPKLVAGKQEADVLAFLATILKTS